MKKMQTTIYSIICVLMLLNVAHAEGNASQGFKLGFGFDRDFGILGSLGNLNGFIGNDGVSVDYIFSKDKLNPQMDWYIAAGGYGDWDGELGVRLPVGAELGFAKSWDAFAQIMPRLKVDHDAKFGLDASIGVRYQF
jgi:hypothetical protein